MPIAIIKIFIVRYGVNSSIIIKAKPIANIIVPTNISHICIEDLPIIPSSPYLNILYFFNNELNLFEL